MKAFRVRVVRIPVLVVVGIADAAESITVVVPGALGMLGRGSSCTYP